MLLSDYLDGMRTAMTADELEVAIQAPFKHSFLGRTWSQISKVRIEAGNRIVAAHPHSFYIPRYGDRRILFCCGETYKIGRGQNSAGVRYCWHAAGVWAQARLRENGFSIRAAYRMWESGWHDYPHRSIALVEKVLAGGVPDPELNVLHRYRSSAGPINYNIERNNADKWDFRANRPCECGGTLFDWGGGHSEGFEFINWHCNKCPDVFTEYMSREQFYALRQAGRAALSGSGSGWRGSYRLLETTDTIQAGDEVIGDDGVTWCPVDRWSIGCEVSRLFKSIRRASPAAPQQEGE